MASQVAFQLVAETDEAKRQMEKFFDEFQGNAKRVEGANKKAGESLSDGFGKAVIQMATIAASAATVKQLFGEVERIGTEGLAKLETSAAGIRRFAQLGGGAVAIAKREELARELAVGQGIDKSTAQQAVFDLQSQGLNERQVRQSFDLYELDEAAAGSIAVGAAMVQKGFGKEEAGDFRAIANKILVAAGGSPTAAAGFAPSLSKVAPIAGMIGASDEETMAAVAAIGSVQGNDVAANQLRAFALKADELARKNNLETGGGFIATAKRIREAGLENDLSQESLLGFRQILDSEGEITASTDKITMGELNTNTDLDFIRSQANSIYEARPDILALKKRNRARQRRAIAEEDSALSSKEALQDAAVDNSYAEALEGNNADGSAAILNRPVTGFLDMVGASPEVIETAGGAVNNYGNFAFETSWREHMTDLAAAIRDNTATTRESLHGATAAGTEAANQP